MTEAEFLTEVNNAMRLPSTPSVGGPAFCGSENSPQFSSDRSSERSPFSAEASGLAASALAALAGGGGPPEGKIPSIFGGVSRFVAPPFAAANAVAEGLVKGAEGVAGALAGLSLGLEDAEGSTGGFSMPPEAVEVGGARGEGGEWVHLSRVYHRLVDENRQKKKRFILLW